MSMEITVELGRYSEMTNVRVREGSDLMTDESFLYSHLAESSQTWEVLMLAREFQ